MGNSASKTPAPQKDRVKGSRTNKAGSAASKKSAQGIKLNASIIAGLTKKAKEYNEKHPNGKVSVTTLKAVMRRGMGAYSSSHRPTITGGAPNTRQAWAYARVNAFLRKKGGQGAKPKYVQDDDLLEDGGLVGVPKTETLIELVAKGRENKIKEWYKQPYKVVVARNDGYAYKIETDEDYQFIDAKNPSNKKVLEIIKSNPDLTEIRFNGTIKVGDRVGEPLEVADDFSVVLWQKGNSLFKVGQKFEFVQDNGKYLNTIVDKKDTITYKDRQDDGNYIYYKQLDKKYGTLSEARSKKSILKEEFDNNEAIFVKDNYADGGQLGKEITCVNCGWHWNTNDSDPSDKYVCHKCGYDNRTYYDKDPIGEYNKYEIYKSIGPLRQANETIEKIQYMERQMEGGGVIEKGQLIEYNHSGGASVEAKFLLKVGENKARIEILNNYTPYTKRVMSNQYVNPAGRTEPANLLKEVPRGTIKIVSVNLIEPITEKTFKHRAKPISKWLKSPEFKEAFGYLDNPTGSMAHGGLTKTLSVADVHKKYPELPKRFINAQLYIGMKAEMEHTKNHDVAKKIALDHLNESPFYYEYLTKMEKELEGLDVKQHYNEQKNYAKGGEINPDNKGVKDYFAHGSGNVGGVLIGKRHSEGGIKAVNKSTNQPLEMEGGEVVITRNAVSDNEKREFEGEMLTNRQILSRINESGGGVSFADGGDIPESIHTSGKEYAYGGKMVKDHDIVSSCGCKHSMAEGGKLATEEFNEMYGHTFKNGGQIYGEGGMVRIINKEIPTYYGFQELFNGLKVPNLRKEYEGFLKENYKINFMQLPQKIRTGLLLGSQKLIDKYINA